MPDTPANPIDAAALEPIAANALAAIVDAGARALIAEPWRASRIIRGAQHLSIEELAAQAARRRRAAPAVLNQAIALAQLSRALQSPLFRDAWTKWRKGAEGERPCTSDARLPALNTCETDAALGDSASLIA
jgi:hypothetical protein